LQDFLSNTKPIYDETPRMRWCHNKEYEVKGGYIIPKVNGDPIDYNPFDFYEKTTEKLYSESPHQVFSSIDLSNKRSIESFYYKYGPLGFYHKNIIKLVTYNPLFSKFRFPEGIPIAAVSREGLNMDVDWMLHTFDDLISKYRIPKNKFKDVNQDNIWLNLSGIEIEPCDPSESLNDFMEACNQFKWIMDLNSNLERANYTELRQLLKSTGTITGYNIDDANDKQISRTVSSLIFSSIYCELDKSVSPALDWDETGYRLSRNVTWNCDSLLTSMYLMLLLDITKSKFNTKCRKCGKWFTSVRSHGEYCSGSCKFTSNKENQKYNKELLKKDEVVSMLMEDKTISEICKTTGLRKKTIEKWKTELERNV
jgi:hypothetical protein